MGRAHQGRNSVFPEGVTIGTVSRHSLARLQTLETSLSVKMKLTNGMVLDLLALKLLGS